MSDTIVALATPFGKSGIGVIRLSGDDALLIAQKLIRKNQFYPEPRKSYLQQIFDIDSEEYLDDALITYFKAPHSFTGEDVVEISCHGSPVVLRQIIDFCLKLKARMAEPGEFSLRSLSNKKINLTQAEAIRDLIEAQTVTAARQSIRQLKGEVSKQLEPIKDKLLEIIVILESSLEFVEDDLPDVQIVNIKNRLSEIVQEIDRMASTFQIGKVLCEGIKVVIVGRPNVGKSSLFNALLGKERAIVTDIAGTTRDHLHEKIIIKNIPVSLVDTAGLRETNDLVESLGVERAKQVMYDADLIVVLLDASTKLTEEDLQIISEIKELNHLIAINKIDLARVDKLNFDSSKVIEISAKTLHGLENLQNEIVEPFLPGTTENESFFVSNARHYDLLLRALEEIKKSIFLIDEKRSEEIILVGLHNGLNFLGKITGETTTEDMLTQVFSTFCIGK